MVTECSETWALASLMTILPAGYTGVVLFSASWAGEACISARQVLEAMKHTSPSNIQIIEIEDDEGDGEASGLFDKYAVETVPTFLAFENGVLETRFSGSKPADIRNFICETSKNEKQNGGDSGNSLEDRMMRLIGLAPLMLFIKGTPEMPQCGFTGQLIRLLSENGLDHSAGHYATFNILKDSEIREALKLHSQWPTYPQIYWRGELLGGLDILKELFASGQMTEIMQEIRGGC